MGSAVAAVRLEIERAAARAVVQARRGERGFHRLAERYEVRERLEERVGDLASAASADGEHGPAFAAQMDRMAGVTWGWIGTVGAEPVVEIVATDGSLDTLPVDRLAAAWRREDR